MTSPKPMSPPAYTTLASVPSTSTPVVTSPPPTSYPAVLVGRPTSSLSETKPKIPPPVPPRGTPKAQRPTNGKGATYLPTNGTLLHDLLCLSLQPSDFHRSFDYKTTLDLPNLHYSHSFGHIDQPSTSQDYFHLKKVERHYDLNIEDIPLETVDHGSKRSISMNEKHLHTYKKNKVSAEKMKFIKQFSADEVKNINHQQKHKINQYFKGFYTKKSETESKENKTIESKTKKSSIELKVKKSMESKEKKSIESKDKNRYGIKVKALKNIFDKSSTDDMIPTYRKPKHNPNFIGASSYVDNKKRYENIPKIVISPSSSYDNESNLYSPERKFGYEVYNSKTSQRYYDYVSSSDLGDLV